MTVQRVTSSAALVGWFCLAAVACGRRAEQEGGDADTQQVSRSQDSAAATARGAKRLDAGALTFATHFFREIVERDRAKNVFVSPLSAAQALGMVYEGAAGRTRQEMARVLGVTDTSAAGSGAELVRTLTGQQDVTLTVGNSLWAREGVPFTSAYLERVRRDYRAEIASLDLSSAAALERINGWVSRETRGKIPRVLEEPLRGDDVLLLVNAVYFKGRWKDEFDKQATRERPFHLASGGRRSVPMMSRTGGYRHLRAAGFQVVRLPYKGDRFAMYVFLPDSGSSLASLYAGAWVDRLDSLRPADVHVVLPRFTLRYSADLAAPLAEMGMPSAFDQVQADLSRMLPREYLAGQNAYISKAKQDVYVEVNEEGTEAAAATSITVSVTSAPPPPIEFVVDRPFVAVIRDDATGALLFIGQVVDPGAPRP